MGKKTYIFLALGALIIGGVVFIIVLLFVQNKQLNKSKQASQNNNLSENSKIHSYNESDLKEKLGNTSLEDQTEQNFDSSETGDTSIRKAAGDSEMNDSFPSSETSVSQKNAQQEDNTSPDTQKSEQKEEKKNEAKPTSSARIVMPKSTEEQQTIDAIASLCAQKLGKSPQEINIVIDFNSGGYAKGVYGFETEPGGGLFLAQGSGSEWNLLWYGEGENFCSETSQYDIPEEMRLECK